MTHDTAPDAEVAAARHRPGPPPRGIGPGRLRGHLPELILGALILAVAGRGVLGPLFSGAAVETIGFVRSTPGSPAGEFLLTRFMVSCCAADAIPVAARVAGVTGPLPANETWAEVEGAWVANPIDLAWEAGDGAWAAIAATSVRPIPEPREPYEPG